MAAFESLGPQFLYHAAPPEARESIRREGLYTSDPYNPEIHELGPEQAPEGVYLRTWRSSHGRAVDEAISKSRRPRDVWRVRASGLDLYRDPDDPEGDYGFHYTPYDISPSRLSLAYPARKKEEDE